ncbi:hypothetical protein V1477_001512 [Vespula maculifrons]|uniref:Uncharacterized protein n=1 Tax=Vespula maculifrons TaxID=7453 RepID=A0ABD2D029_VESMC
MYADRHTHSRPLELAYVNAHIFWLISPRNYLFHYKFQYEASLASKISAQFYDYLFTPSNIATSYGAYSRTIADNSLSLSLSGLVNPPDHCECPSFS